MAKKTKKTSKKTTKGKAFKKKPAARKAAPKKKSGKGAARTKAPSKKAPNNVVVWFELPVADLDRAVKFYAEVLGYQLDVMDMGASKGAMFPYEMGGASGALIQSNENQPSSVGTMIYLNGGKDLSIPLGKVVAAGGKVIQDKLEIGEYGFMAIFEDTEGNHVALHSMS